MKKTYLTLLLFITFLLGENLHVSAQCYGVVHYDTSSAANGASNFNINTTYSNELILISYDGWPSPGLGPVTVDGNPATHLVTGFDNDNSGVAEVYAYSAPAAGVHAIVCTEPAYSAPYYLNFAASFYATGTQNPINICSLIYPYGTITCTTGGYITDSIYVAQAGSMVYCNFENNNGQGGPFIDSWTGANFLASLHEGNGLDASHAYQPAPTIGFYSFTVGNNAQLNNGCGGLVLDMIDIPPPPCFAAGLSARVTQANPVCGNSNGSITLAVSGGASPYSYVWTPPVSTSASATGLSAGTYSIIVSDAACHDTALALVLPADVLGLTANTLANILCNGNCVGKATAIVSGGTSPYTYSWTPTGGTHATATGLCAGTYTIAANDANACSATATIIITQPPSLTLTMGAPTHVLCNGENNGSASLTASGGTPSYSYSWKPGGGNSAAKTGLTAGTYTVTVTDSCSATVSASVTITQPNAINVSAINLSSHCNQSDGSVAASVSGGTMPYTYSWSAGGNTNAGISALSAGTYTVVVTDNNGCTKIATTTIVNIPGETASVGVIKNVTCFNSNNGSIKVNVTGGATPYLYSWTASGQTNATASGLSIGTYTVTITDAFGCTSITSATITQPTQLILNAGTASVCAGESDTLTVAGSGGVPSYTYYWTPAGGTSATGSDLTAGTYKVTLTDANGCKATDKVVIALYPPALAAFQPTPDSVHAGEMVNFINNSGTNPIYHWNFGDGNTSTLENPEHEYSYAGTYFVSLIVTNSNGCSDTLMQEVYVTDKLMVPNVFTPNGDGINDVFLVQAASIKTYNLQIFNRWGKKVFESQSPTISWTGTNSSGSPEANGTYYWVLQATDYSNKPFSLNGFVELIR